MLSTVYRVVGSYCKVCRSTIQWQPRQTVPTEGEPEGAAEGAPARCQPGSVGGAGHGRGGRVSWGGPPPPPYRALQPSQLCFSVLILSTSSCGLSRPAGASAVRKICLGGLASAAAAAAPMQGTARPNSSGVRRKYPDCSTAALQQRALECGLRAPTAASDHHAPAGSLEEFLRVTLPL